MKIDLRNTSVSQVGAAITANRPGRGMVLTLIVVSGDDGAADMLRAATEACRQHPSRIIGVITTGPTDAASSLDAQVLTGHRIGAGETVVLRMSGGLAAHADAVVLPLLLPDTPVVAWWPGESPADPAKDPVGALAARRITDLAREPGAADGGADGHLEARADCHCPGDTDLAWTRTTPWRSMLAAALDQEPAEVTAASVAAAPGDPSARLLARWLELRLGVPVDLTAAAGDATGIAEAALRTGLGPIVLRRTGDHGAHLSVPGRPDRHVPLRRRGTAELLAEELQRLDPDETYAAVLRGRAQRK